MNKIHACLSLICALLFSSCVTTKTYTSEEKLMRLDGDVFVITNDDRKVSGDKISGASLWITKASWVKLDGETLFL